MTSIRPSRSASAVAALLLTASAAWGQANNGNGLLAEHYDSNTFGGAVILTTPNSVVNKDYGTTEGPNGTAAPIDNFSSRYRGEIEGPLGPGSNAVTFQLESDDQAELWIDGVRVINHGGVATTNYATNLVGGQRYQIMVTHREGGGGARIHLRWQHAGNGAMLPVPAINMFSPAAAPATPTINVNGGTAPQSVTLSTATGGAQIWYTTDGSDPGLTMPSVNPSARQATGPFDMTVYGRIRARAYVGGVSSGLLVTNVFSPSFAPTGFTPAVLNNLYYRYYNNPGGLGLLPDYEAAVPEKRGLAPIPGNGTRLRDTDYGYKFTGYVNVPATGTWTFQSRTDDGSKLWIGANLVVDNDGGHGTPSATGVEHIGTIDLQAGWHPFTLTHFQGAGGHSIEVRWNGPGVADEIIQNLRFGTDALAAVVTSVPAAGTSFATSQNVTLNCATPGATIYWTLDGTPPDPRRAHGAGPSGTVVALTATTRLRAIATAPGFLPGDSGYDQTFIRTNPALALRSAVAAGVPTGVEVNFRNTVTNPSASTAGNYAIDNGITVSGAALQPRNNDLLMWLKLDEAAGPTAADSSPIGTNSGTWTNSPSADMTNFAPVTGNTTSLAFQAADSDYVSVADSASLAFGSLGSFTVAAWIRPADTTNRRLINKWDGPGDRGWIVDLHTNATGNLRFRVDDGTNNTDYAVAAGIVANQWQHIACRFDRLNFRVSLFRNGVFIGSADTSTNFGNPDTARPILLGRLENPTGTASGNHYNGNMDDVRVYGVALSDAEIAGLAAGAVDPSTRVILTTSALTADAPTYTLTVNGVQGMGGSVVSNVTTPFIYRTGSLTDERYDNVGGGNVWDLTRNAVFPDSATATGLVTVAEVPQTAGPNIENFGRRLRGYFIPPTSGNWVFSVEADDGSALFLSTNDDPARKRRVAYGTAWAAFRDHADPDILQSGPRSGGDTNNLQLTIPLVAGQKYYMEAYAKEGGGGDHIAVAAKIDDGTQIAAAAASIPAANLAPYVEGVSVNATLPDRALLLGQPLSVTVTASGSGLSYQWRKGGVPIGGQTSATLSIASVVAGDAGNYDVVVTGLIGSGTGGAFTLTVITPPAPTITAVTPTSGPQGGGQTIRVTGTNLLYGLTSLTLGGAPATNLFWSGSETFLYAQTPAHAPGNVNAVVNAAGQSATLVNGYGYDTPTIATITPAFGDNDGGTNVTITGTLLGSTGVTTVTFGGSPATSVVVNAAGTSLTCVTPAHAAGVVDVVVTSAIGSGTSTGGFTYYGDPTLATINPPNGPDQGGAPTVTLTGTNFVDGLTTVNFGATPGTGVAVNGPGTSLTVTPPSGAGVVSVTVVTPGGTSPGLAYTYYADPAATSLSPTSGSNLGNQDITIFGTGFAPMPYTSVSFGAAAGTVQSVAADGLSLVVRTPAGSGTVGVTVTTPGGTTSPALNYTYYVAPTATSVVNNAAGGVFGANGDADGNDAVTITGTNFVAPVTVTFGGVAATNVVIVSATQITATTPAGTGTVAVVVSNPGGNGTFNSWVYHANPGVTSVVANSGTTQGGDSRTVNGSNMPNGLTIVAFDGAPATGVNASGSTAIVTTPANFPGPADVVVTTPGGIATLSAGYTYTGSFVSSISPDIGPVAGGQAVTISGDGFTGATGVQFGGTTQSVITVNPAGTQITLNTPAAAGPGAVNVTILAPAGNFVVTNGYTYTGTPTITGVSPNQGPVSGGQTITITGTNFASGFTTVSVGGNPATGVTVTGTTQITALTPPGSAGAANVVVTTYTNQPSAPSGYTYFNAPTFTSLSPVRGSTNGGQLITLLGSDFVAGSTQVLVAGTSATAITVAGDGASLTALTPPGPAGATTVSLTTFGMGTPLTRPYTYIDHATGIDLRLTMSVNNPSASVGQNVTFTLTLFNEGAANGSGISVTNFLPPTMSFVSANPPAAFNGVSGVWTVGALNSGANTVLTITATVNSATNMTNVAEVTTATQQDYDSVPNNADLTEDDRATASVDAGLQITTGATLAPGTARAYYSATVAASGGAQPYTWSLVTSTPAFPFSLNPETGEISGFAPDIAVPTVYNFTLGVSDASAPPQTDANPFSITINPGNGSAPSINGGSPAPDGVLGQAYSHVFTATSGTGPYTWSVTGSLPAGLALDPFTGRLGGTPTAVGAASFSVVATSPTTGASAPLPVTFSIGANPISFTPVALPDGTVNSLYSHVLEVSGGIGPFNWSTTGTLPSNVALSGSPGRRIVISGTPAAAATSNFSVIVTDAGQTGVTDTNAYTVTIAAAGGALAITTQSPLPTATVGRAYSVTLSGAGGTPPYFWSIAPGGSLPSGLSINGGSGVISGTPAPLTAGVYTFTVQQQQFGGGPAPATAAMTLEVAPAPTLTGSLTLPGAVEGAGYFAELSFTGGAEPVTWSVDVGSTLPAGLTLNATSGTIQGTPTGSGATTFSLTATDANGATVSGTFSLTIAPSAGLQVVTTSLPQGQVGVPYSATLQSSGGTAPRTWSVLTGTLPAWATLDPDTGTISGTPTAVSSTNLTFQVTDAVPASDSSGTLNLTIVSALTVTTTSLPAASNGFPYGTSLAATGGSTPYVWTVASGSLPAGLTLSTSGAINGIVSASAVSSTFQARVTDAQGRTASRSFTITVSASPPPGGGGGSGGGGGCGGTIGLRTLPWGALAGLAALLALGGRRRNR